MSKFGNRRTTVDGHNFASAKEARRYQELLLLQHAGEIVDLELQPRYIIEVNGGKICEYVADFRYRNREDDRVVVEDVKGGSATKTAVYRVKKKLMKFVHDIDILET